MTKNTIYSKETIEFLKDPECRKSFEAEYALSGFSAGIEKAMKRDGLSHKALADKTGKSRQAISRALRGEQNLSVGTMIDLAFAVGCTVGLTVEPLETLEMANDLISQNFSIKVKASPRNKFHFQMSEFSGPEPSVNSEQTLMVG